MCASSPTPSIAGTCIRRNCCPRYGRRCCSEPCTSATRCSIRTRLRRRNTGATRGRTSPGRSGLAQYEPILDPPSESGQIEQLRRQIDDFRSTVIDVLDTDSTRWPTDARLLLRNRIMPKREGVIRVSEEVQALNRASFVQQQQATAQVYAATQRRILTQFGLALIASFLIGLVATRHVASLEANLREQQSRDAQNTAIYSAYRRRLITAQEEERRTIARELHDEVGQVLTAIKVELAVAQRRVESAGGSPTLLADARSITEGALHTVATCRGCSTPRCWTTWPAAGRRGLHSRVSQTNSVSVELLQERMERRLPQETEATAYRSSRRR